MKKLEWLEAMRGIAACWVLAHHTSLAVRDFSKFASPQFLANGFLGVDFFFVLSGFIIAFSSQHLVANGGGWKKYASARAIRIYVPYLPVGLTMLALYELLPGLSAGTRTDIGVITTLTLLPTNTSPALSVAWTLVHEVLFYALFSIFFISTRALAAVLVGWSSLIVAAWAAGLELSRAASYLLSPINLCFVLGVSVTWLTRRGVTERIAAMLAVGGLGTVITQAVAVQPNRVLIALGFAALVAASRSTAATKQSPGRLLMGLGAASYAIYLVHNTAISIAVRAAVGIRQPIVLVGVVGATALCAGLAYHFFYEAPALRWLRIRLAGAWLRAKMR